MSTRPSLARPEQARGPLTAAQQDLVRRNKVLLLAISITTILTLLAVFGSGSEITTESIAVVAL